MYDGNIVLLAFFLGMVFGLYAEQVIRSVVYAVVSFVMGLPTKHAPEAACAHDWQASTRQNVTAVCAKCGEESPRR